MQPAYDYSGFAIFLGSVLLAGTIFFLVSFFRDNNN